MQHRSAIALMVALLGSPALTGCTAAELAAVLADVNATGAMAAPSSPGTPGTPGTPAHGLPGDTPATADEAKVLALVNDIRAQAGLPPVAFDAAMSRGCFQHAEYLRLNEGTAAVAGLKAHEQDPSLPGATPEGAVAGKASDIHYVAPPAAVVGWMASLYHRTPILDPKLARIGVGTTNGKSHPISVMMFKDHDDAPAALWPVRYPTDGQEDAPLAFGGEIPDPVPGGSAGTGFPVTLQFKAFAKVDVTEARLEDADGQEVPCHVSTPEEPATSFQQGGVVCMIPKHLLAPATAYRATVTAAVDGAAAQTWRWGFKTLEPRDIDVADDAALLAGLGATVRLTGTVVQGGRNGGIYLVITAPGGRSVVVWVAEDVWQRIPGVDSPKALEGRRISVIGSPRDVGGGKINLRVAAPEHLEHQPAG